MTVDEKLAILKPLKLVYNTLASKSENNRLEGLIMANIDALDYYLYPENGELDYEMIGYLIRDSTYLVELMNK